MAECPNCGTEVADTAEACYNCGGQLEQTRDRAQQPQRGQNHPPEDGRSQPPHGQQPQQSQGQYQENQHGGDGGLSRRQLLAGGSAVAATAASGWFFFLRDDTSGGPEDILYDYLDAFENNDPEAMDEVVHPDAPVRDGIANPVDQVTENDEREFSYDVENVEVVNREPAPDQQNVEEFATIEARVSTTTEADGESRSRTETARMIVAKLPDGKWTFWEIGGTESESNTD